MTEVQSALLDGFVFGVLFGAGCGVIVSAKISIQRPDPTSTMHRRLDVMIAMCGVVVGLLVAALIIVFGKR